MSGVMMGCSYQYLHQSPLLFVSTQILCLYTFSNENWLSFEAEIHSASRQSNSQGQINRRERERERGKSVRLIRINRDALVIWPWLIHDLLLLDTGNGCLITSIKEQPLSQRINAKDHDTGAQEAVHTVCDVLWSALSFTITRALGTLPIYTTSCFCAVTVNALKIFVLDCASPV